jgi:hypothetical protein
MIQSNQASTWAAGEDRYSCRSFAAQRRPDFGHLQPAYWLGSFLSSPQGSPLRGEDSREPPVATGQAFLKKPSQSAFRLRYD